MPTPLPKPIPTELESLLQRLLSRVPALTRTPTIQDRHHGIGDLAAASASGDAMFLLGFPQEGALVLSGFHTDINLFYHLLELLDCFDILCGMDMMCRRFVFPQDCLPGICYNWVLSDTWILDVTGVRFDVSGASLLCEGDSVRFGPSLMMSDDTGDGNWFPLTTAARSRGGGSGRCGWLQFVTQGAGPVSHEWAFANRSAQPKKAGRCMSGVCTSFAGDRVTACFSSNLLLYCAVYRSSCDCLPVPGLYLESFIQFVCGATDNRCTVPEDYIVGAMASGDSWLECGQFRGLDPGSVERNLSLWWHLTRRGWWFWTHHMLRMSWAWWHVTPSWYES